MLPHIIETQPKNDLEITPNTLQALKFGNSFSPACWRKCGHTGSILHRVWSCNCLNKVWNTIFDIVSEITTQFLSPSPKLALLNLGINAIPPKFRHVNIHLLLVARITMTRHWKSDHNPPFIETIDIIQTHYMYEKTMASSSGSYKQSASRWHRWVYW